MSGSHRLHAIPASVQRTGFWWTIPPWHSRGDDMGVEGGRIVRGGTRLTYGNIAAFHPSLFREIAPGTIRKLFPWAYRFADEGRVTGEHYRGPWDNVGTAGQLEALDKRISR